MLDLHFGFDESAMTSLQFAITLVAAVSNHVAEAWLEAPLRGAPRHEGARPRASRRPPASNAEQPHTGPGAGGLLSMRASSGWFTRLIMGLT